MRPKQKTFPTKLNSASTNDTNLFYHYCRNAKFLKMKASNAFSICLNSKQNNN